MKHLKQLDLMSSFPWPQYPKIRSNQKEALEIIEKQGGSVILELPTGSGKTAIGYTVLKALEKLGQWPLFYIAPTKTIVEQVQSLHPEVKVIFGRNEYPCLYYENEEVTAEESPCSLLNCPHRVDQITGEVEDEGFEPCPYLFAKYEARQGGITVCTNAFYLFSHLFTDEWPTPAGLIIDEAHRIARTVRSCLSYEITDFHLGRCIEFLSEIDPESACLLRNFLRKMLKIIRRRPPRHPTLLEDYEIRELMEEIIKINTTELEKKVKRALKEKQIDPKEQRELLKKLEVITRDLRRYYHSFEYSLPTEQRKPLNYTYAYYERKRESSGKVQYRLVVKAYSVNRIIQQILSPFTVSYSATIGDPQIFSWETGIKGTFYTFPSDFPTTNTKILLPTDTPNLAVKARSKRDLPKILRKIARTCAFFAKAEIRSLVVVISEEERKKFLSLCREEEVEAISYGNGIKPKEAATRFKNGEGKVLVGTAANFGEGIDLPKGIAPVIFFLRPGYPRIDDPISHFEERRFGQRRWDLWTWRVMIEALQVRGRNIRSAKDIGVCFFISKQFRRFLHSSLPEWLKETYEGGLTFDQCVKETVNLLKI